MTSEESGKRSSEDSFDLNDVLKILYQALRQSIEDPFRILDRDYRLLWINKREPGHQVGQVCYESVFKRGESCPECPVTVVFETNKPATVHRLLKYKDGSEKWREIRAYPVFDLNSEVAYAITIGHDYGEEIIDLNQQQRRIETLERALFEISQSNLEPAPDTTASRPAIDLAERELQVLRLMAEGLTNTEISSILSISPHTVKTYVVRIFNKLGVTDRTQAATLATRMKLI